MQAFCIKTTQRDEEWGQESVGHVSCKGETMKHIYESVVKVAVTKMKR